MSVTTYTNVPARRRSKGRVCTTPAYRKLMTDIGKCLNAGGSVDVEHEQDPAPSSADGSILETISVRLEWPEGSL